MNKNDAFWFMITEKLTDLLSHAYPELDRETVLDHVTSTIVGLNSGLRVSASRSITGALKGENIIFYAVSDAEPKFSQATLNR